MPDPPAPKRIRAPLTPPADGPDAPEPAFPYAELHCKTNFCFLKGLHPTNWRQRAAELRLRGAGDHRLEQRGRRRLVRTSRPGRGLASTHADRSGDHPPRRLSAAVLATDRAAYGRLSQLITRGRRQAEKGDCRLTQADVAEFADGLLACVRLPEGSDENAVDRALPLYRDAFMTAATCARRTVLRGRRSRRRWPIWAQWPAAVPVASGGGQRRSLSRSVLPAAAGRADGRPSWHHGRRAGASPFRQRRTASQIPRGNAAVVCRLPGGRVAHGRAGRPLHVLARRAAL